MGYDAALGPEYVYSHARAFSRHEAFRLVAGIDPDAGRREHWTLAFGCPASADLADALEQHRPDVVVIAVPTPLHAGVLETVLAGPLPKAVLCEKPLSYDAGEGARMVDACAAAGIALYVNYMRRSDAAAIEIRRRIMAGEMGAAIKGVAWYSKGFIHNGSHFFNLCEYWLGPMQDAAVIAAGRSWAGIDPEPDVRVRFAGGEVVFLAAWEEAFSHYTVELLSTSGRLRYDRGGEQVDWQPADAGALGAPQRIASGMDRYQWHVAAQLARALDHQPAEICTGGSALATLQAMSLINARIDGFDRAHRGIPT